MWYRDRSRHYLVCMIIYRKRIFGTQPTLSLEFSPSLTSTRIKHQSSQHILSLNAYPNPYTHSMNPRPVGYLAVNRSLARSHILTLYHANRTLCSLPCTNCSSNFIYTPLSILLLLYRPIDPHFTLISYPHPSSHVDPLSQQRQHNLPLQPRFQLNLHI